MPLLKDTEWRILCVIVRQTLGWQVETRDGRKAWDWLTHSQLKQRTGRNSEAICKAVDSLMRRGLIAIYDSNNRLLATPQERQRCHDRLYFGLSYKTLAQLGGGSFYGMPSDTPLEKSTVKDASKSPSRFTQSEIRKTKTTKETYTKLLRGRVQRSCPQAGDNNGMRMGQWTKVGSTLDRFRL